jgi:hypothetical protein
MSCVLHIADANFDLDSFLTNTNLKPYSKHYIGELIHQKSKKKFKDNGCSFDLSSADFDNFEQQQKDAIWFLTNNFKALSRLNEFGILKEPKGRIDFGIISRLTNPSIAIQTDEFEVELLRLASSLGFSILLSQYHFKECR